MVVTMLIHTTSFVFQLPAYVTIHNQCSNIELVSPIYFGNGAVCPKLSGQQINISTEMKTNFKINASQDDFEGAFLFRLKRHAESDEQCNINTSTTENEAACIYMLVAWKTKDSKPFLYVALVEHTKTSIWDEDKLKEIYNKNRSWLKKYYSTTSDTWFVNDHMALKTTFKVRGLKENFELSISISEEDDDYAMRPFSIDLTR
jgi:hypothetical protein